MCIVYGVCVCVCVVIGNSFSSCGRRLVLGEMEERDGKFYPVNLSIIWKYKLVPTRWPLCISHSLTFGCVVSQQTRRFKNLAGERLTCQWIRGTLLMRPTHVCRLNSISKADCRCVSGDQRTYCPTQDSFESEVNAINSHTRKTYINQYSSEQISILSHKLF